MFWGSFYMDYQGLSFLGLRIQKKHDKNEKVLEKENQVLAGCIKKQQ